ncbi:hypothetical protein B0H13DRAFT_755578 [Mycena leptocephala]|nr:hypothetical protein B0H13DRAFT_755578 [Mycena leptocephala]
MLSRKDYNTHVINCLTWTSRGRVSWFFFFFFREMSMAIAPSLETTGEDTGKVAVEEEPHRIAIEARHSHHQQQRRDSCTVPPASSAGEKDEDDDETDGASRSSESTADKRARLDTAVSTASTAAQDVQWPTDVPRRRAAACRHHARDEGRDARHPPQRGPRPARRARIRHPLHVHRQPRVDLFLLRPRDACRARHRPCYERR